MAVVIAKVDKSDPSLAFKYRLADCLTKRRLGDFIKALENADALLDEVLSERAKHADGSKLWDKLTRISVDTLKERVCLLARMQKYQSAEDSYEASLALQLELYGGPGASR